MRRACLAATVAAIALGPAAGQALALAVVTFNSDTRALTVAVQAAPGSDDDHGIGIRPGFDRVRVEQLQLGDGALTSTAADIGPTRRCPDINLIFNTVTCPLFPASVVIRGGDGADVVHMGPSDPQPGHPTPDDPCIDPEGVSGGVPVVPVSINLGPGDDGLLAIPNDDNSGLVESTFCLVGFKVLTDAFNPSITASGGSGDDDLDATGPLTATLSGDEGKDVLLGGTGADLLSGGPGGDRIDGLSGADIISGGDGLDDLEGGPDDDQIVGGEGNDLEKGGDRNDTFSDATGRPDGADDIRGDIGTDTVDYSRRTGDLDVHVDNDAGDGEAGEGDALSSIERVLGGSGDDLLVGNRFDNTLKGAAGRDHLVGGAGIDVLDTGVGDDTVLSVDGIRDTITCGPGSDRADLDLQDVVTPTLSRGPTGTILVPDCESIARHARDDSPPGTVAGGRLTVAGGRALVPFACPRAARPGCRGTLTVRALARPGRVLGGARYAFPVGGAGTVAVRLRPGAAGALRRGGRAIVRTVERGHSRIGPRGVQVRLRVA